MDTILVVNAGSSSVKFQVFTVEGEGRLRRQIKGQMDGIGSRPRLRASGPTGDPLADRAYPIEAVADVPAAMAVAGAWLRDEMNINPIAVGHRVVHGGPDYAYPVLIDHAVVTRLERYVSLAPLHQPHDLAPIRTLLNNFPALPQVACFDTAFHRDHDALGRSLRNSAATSCRRHQALRFPWVVLRVYFQAPAAGRTGNRERTSDRRPSRQRRLDVRDKGGKSVESTMGFTALDGLAMGTRPGQIDPGVVLYLISEKGMSASNVQNFLYRDCGLKGLSGVSNDMRELETSADPRAAFAIDYFVYRIGLNAGMLAAALQGLDAFVFTAGIGENSVSIRARVAEKLVWLGVALDPAANARHVSRISVPDSRIPVYVVPTDEELMIAQHTLGLLMNRQSPNPETLRCAAGKTYDTELSPTGTCYRV